MEAKLKDFNYLRINTIARTCADQEVRNVNFKKIWRTCYMIEPLQDSAETVKETRNHL